MRYIAFGQHELTRAATIKLILVALCTSATSASQHKHVYLAVDLKHDGLGAQLQPKLTCMMEANTNPGWTYVHVPFRAIEHGLNASECEAWFNVGENELALTSLPSVLPDGVEVRHAHGCHGFADQHPSMWSGMKDGLRRKYFSPSATAKPSIPQFRHDAVNLAVHMRRGDVIGNCGLGGPQDAEIHERSRCIPTHYVAGVIGQVVRKLENITKLPINVQIFTEGSNKNGELDELKLAAPTVGLNFDGNVLHVFHALMSADVYIMAHSSFSLMAAVYGAPEQLVIYDQFWHAGAPNWIKVTNGIVGGQRWSWEEDYMYRQAVGMAEARWNRTKE